MSEHRQEKHASSEEPLAAPVEAVTGVWRFSRAPGGYHRARSLPGHLLHLVLAGSYRLRTNAREYDVHPADVIYYHETEEVEWLGNRGRVTFYSVGFLAPSLEPLLPESRVFPSTPEMRGAFDDLYAGSLLAAPGPRALAVHSALLRVMLEVGHWRRGSRPAAPPAARTWWELESLLRERRTFRPTLDELGRMCNRSRASVVRSCRAATGTSPMRRLHEVRMAEARGLLRHSALSVTQIAAYLGYPRMHEFSREFSRRFGRPPTAERA